MDSTQKAIAEGLLDSGAFKISLDPLFTWTSGIKSPVYCDLRALISSVTARRLIVEAFQSQFPELAQVHTIAGTATAGIPWAAWIAEALGKPMIYVRGAAKEHGTKKRVEGHMRSGIKVVLIEDHISTGGSSISAVEALREEGAVVEGIFAINTYQLKKADEAFGAAGIKVKTLIDYGIILAVAKEKGLIDDGKEVLLTDFRTDPSGWALKNNL